MFDFGEQSIRVPFGGGGLEVQLPSSGLPLGSIDAPRTTHAPADPGGGAGARPLRHRDGVRWGRPYGGELVSTSMSEVSEASRGRRSPRKKFGEQP